MNLGTKLDPDLTSDKAWFLIGIMILDWIYSRTKPGMALLFLLAVLLVVKDQEECSA